VRRIDLLGVDEVPDGTMKVVENDLSASIVA